MKMITILLMLGGVFILTRYFAKAITPPPIEMDATQFGIKNEDSTYDSTYIFNSQDIFSQTTDFMNGKILIRKLEGEEWQAADKKFKQYARQIAEAKAVYDGLPWYKKPFVSNPYKE